MKNTTAAISICALYFTSSLPEMKTTTANQEDHHKKNARGIMFSVTVWNRTILNCWAPVTPGSKFPNWNTKGMAVQRATHWDVEMVWKKNLGYWGILVVRCPQMIFSEHSCSVPSPEWLQVSPYLLSSCSSSEKNKKKKKSYHGSNQWWSNTHIHNTTATSGATNNSRCSALRTGKGGVRKWGTTNLQISLWVSHQPVPPRSSAVHTQQSSCGPMQISEGWCSFSDSAKPDTRTLNQD